MFNHSRVIELSYGDDDNHELKWQSPKGVKTGYMTSLHKSWCFMERPNIGCLVNYNNVERVYALTTQ